MGRDTGHEEGTEEMNTDLLIFWAIGFLIAALAYPFRRHLGEDGSTPTWVFVCAIAGTWPLLLLGLVVVPVMAAWKWRPISGPPPLSVRVKAAWAAFWEPTR